MDWLLQQTQGRTIFWCLLGIMVLGSCLDIVQFIWLARRWLKRWKRRILEEAKKELMLETWRKNAKGP